MKKEMTTFSLFLNFTTAASVLALSAHALVSCPPNICDPIACKQPKNCEFGRLSRDASFCGCCLFCINFLKADNECESILRVPRILECAPDRECDPQTMRCIAKKAFSDRRRRHKLQHIHARRA